MYNCIRSDVSRDFDGKLRITRNAQLSLDGRGLDVGVAWYRGVIREATLTFHHLRSMRCAEGSRKGEEGGSGGWFFTRSA